MTAEEFLKKTSPNDDHGIREAMQKGELSYKMNLKVMENFSNSNLILFVDWFGTWQMDKELNDYSVDDILTEYKHRSPSPSKNV